MYTINLSDEKAVAQFSCGRTRIRTHRIHNSGRYSRKNPRHGVGRSEIAGARNRTISQGSVASIWNDQISRRNNPQ